MELVGVFGFNSIVVALAVLIHYEVLSRLATVLPMLDIRPRLRVLVAIFAAFIAHVAEIWTFALAFYLLLQVGGQHFGRQL